LFFSQKRFSEFSGKDELHVKLGIRSGFHSWLFSGFEFQFKNIIQIELIIMWKKWNLYEVSWRIWFGCYNNVTSTRFSKVFDFEITKIQPLWGWLIHWLLIS
jgi:hypothetical protein